MRHPRPPRQWNRGRSGIRPRRSHRRPDWTTLAIPAAIAGAAMIAGWLSTGPTVSLPSLLVQPELVSLMSPSRITVVDGDTVRVGGRLTRLVGFNTPETYEAQCAAERRLGDRATGRLRQLLASGPVDFAEVRCACRPGTEGTNRCNYGRACGTLRVNGRDVGDILIAEGLAVRFVCGGTGCPPTPRPWCAS